MDAGRGRAFEINVAVFQFNDLELRSRRSQRNSKMESLSISWVEENNVRDTICNRRDHITGLVAPSTCRRKAARVRAWNPREQLNKFTIGRRRCCIAACA